GDFPVNVALHPDGKFLAVLHAGHGPHEIVVVELLSGKNEREVCRVRLTQTFHGLTFSPDGKTLYASGGEFAVVHAFAFDADGLRSGRKEVPVADLKETFVVGGVTTDREGKTLFVAGPWGDK